MDHAERVVALLEQFRSHLGSTLHLEKGSHSSNTTRAGRYKSVGKGLNLDSFCHILSIDEDNKIAHVEPRVSMDQLVKETLKFGLVPAIVPEFKGITVGGAIQGGGIESSSHLFGQFNDICPSYEVLTGDGEVLTVSPEEHSDLYYGIATSYGSLGLILSAEVKLVPAKPYVYIEHHHFDDLSRALAFLNSKRGEEVFLEGLVYAPDHIAVHVGEMVSQPPYHLSPLSLKRNWSKWYYLQTENRKETCLSLYDYLFRHDLGAFWMGSFFFHKKIISRFWLEKFNLLTNRLDQRLRPENSRRPSPGLFGRLFWGSLMPSKRLYRLYHSGSEGWFSEHFVVQDSYIPNDQAEDFIKAISDQLKIFPLWLCPVKATSTAQIFSSHLGNEDFLNIGVYGYPQGYNNGIEATVYLEVLTRSLQGRKMLYCQTHYKEEEFWNIYSRKEYEKLRKKYHASGVFKDITEKVLSK